MGQNEAEIRQLTQALVDAQTEEQISLIDKKLAVLKKHSQ